LRTTITDGQDGVGRCRVRSLVAGSWLWFDAKVTVESTSSNSTPMSNSTSCQSKQAVKWSAVGRQGKIVKATTCQIFHRVAVIFYAYFSSSSYP
uniref:Ig-like domain-containing protein n=1 Tax=Haemonchus placei TaxID=6290 RepID=A0A0N4WDZ6_HAEPC